jgi:hypothetical protein
MSVALLRPVKLAAHRQGMDTRSDKPVLNDRLLAEKEELLVDQ